MKSILLLHGALGAAAQFDLLKEKLKANFNVFTLDFEGHGTSGNNNREFSIEHFAENLNQFLQQHADKKFLIFGYSMGGFVALYAASFQSQNISGIITLGTKFHWDEATAQREIKLLDPEKIKTKVPAFAAQLQALHPHGFETVLNKSAAMMLQLGKQNPLTDERLQQVGIPVKMMLGENDNMVTETETLHAFHQIPNAQYQLLPNTQHSIDKVNVEFLKFVIEEFAL